MIIYLICGIVLGLIVGWLIAAYKASSRIQNAEARAISAETSINELRNQLNKLIEEKSKLENELKQLVQAKVQAETELKNATERLNEERKLLEEATQKLTDVFKAIASDTLNASTKNLLELAKENFSKILTEAKGDFGKSQEKISGLLEPLDKKLQQFDEYLKSIEKSRVGAYAELKTYLETLNETQKELKKETSSLVMALRTPQARGRWGEMTLRRVVELAGMTKHCDFEEQVTIKDNTNERKQQRPDMIIHLPDDKVVVVDAKVSLDAYLKAIEAKDEKQREDLMKQHSKQIKDQIDRLIEADYSKILNNTLEFTVMFIPGESFFSAAMEYDRELFEYALKNKVVLATPATLLALLRAISFSWQQAKVMKSAEEILTYVRELYDRVDKVLEHISQLGKGLTQAVESYNSTISSIETRMLPTFRKFYELGVVSKEMEQPDQIQKLTRSFRKELKAEEKDEHSKT